METKEKPTSSLETKITKHESKQTPPQTIASSSPTSVVVLEGVISNDFHTLYLTRDGKNANHN